jgi:hypothetical protein
MGSNNNWFCAIKSGPSTSTCGGEWFVPCDNFAFSYDTCDYMFIKIAFFVFRPAVFYLQKLFAQ